jgi:diguanylate cyclase (GGDEF)-like protein
LSTHVYVSRFAERLEGLKGRQAWSVIIVATLAIMAADYTAPSVFAPLYLVVVCAACWCLGRRASYGVALGDAFLAILAYIAAGDWRHPILVGLAVAVRFATFCFVASIIAGCRTLYDRSQFLAHRDRMTGALNQETFRERAIDTMEMAKASEQTMLLAILDLDDFKTLNNRHGHAAGDAVLRAFARAAKGILRREDQFGRLGGDEFAFLAPVDSHRDGEILAATLHQRLSAVLAETSYPVTCSMGALIIGSDAPRDIPAMIHIVDVLMYAVKRAGKNAVRIASASAELVSQNRDFTRPLEVAVTG